MTRLTWLHLSDWHQKGPDLDRKVVRDALIKDIRGRAERIDGRLEQVDFVVFSGDLAYYGQPDEYKAAQENLFDPVLEAVGLKPDRLFIVPGNHDLSRIYVYKMLPPELQQPLSTNDQVNEWLTSDELRKRALEPFKVYSSFVTNYTGQSSPDYASILRLDAGGKRIALLGLNSAWMCARNKNSKGEVDDARHLLVGEAQIYDALEQIADADLRIAVLHHPFDWLAEFDRFSIEDRLGKNCHFILRGHEHQPKVNVISGTGGDYVILPAGACYDRRVPKNPRYANSYNWAHLDFDADGGTVYLRRWSDQRGEWIEDIDASPDGKSILKSLPKNLASKNVPLSLSLSLEPPSSQLLQLKSSGDRHILQLPGSQQSVASIRKLVQSQEWLVGAVNFDEDIHFSSLYTRQSTSLYLTGDMRQYGYNRLLAIYEDFNETYYIPKAECIRVANALLDKICKTPEWLEYLLETIHNHVHNLRQVFPFPDGHNPFEELTDDYLWSLYEKHHQVHTDLYRYARIPEALDRGVGKFTKYLNDYLVKKGGQLRNNLSERNKVFSILTMPDVLSTVGQEEIEFTDLVQLISSTIDDIKPYAGSAKRAILLMDPGLLARVRNHQEKWAYWGYHGYASKAMPDVDHYVERILERMGSTQDTRIPQARLEEFEERRQGLFNQYKIDPKHQLIFRLYGRVGVTKLYRRYGQLRNFFFLDRLIAEFSRRTGIREGQLRSLLPEEVMSLVRGDLPITTRHENRMIFAIHVIDEAGEAVLSGSEYRTVQLSLQSSTSGRTPSSRLKGVLVGTPVYPGRVHGQVRKIIRQQDAQRSGFQDGDILVSSNTDPDLLDIMYRSGGVITEEGGVTSHASIACREYEKPTIVGVAGVISALKDGDYVVLDADEGTVRTIHLKRKFTIEPRDSNAEDSALVGPKAASLSLLVRKGLSVPKFFVIPVMNLLVSSGRSSDSHGSELDSVLREVNESLDMLNGDLFVIRSSAAVEDQPGNLTPGIFDSETGVERPDVVKSVAAYIERLRGDGRWANGGSIIVQEMILGDVSGVCLTIDPMSTASIESSDVVIEAVPGDNVSLTSGHCSPAHYLVNRSDRTISLAQGHGQITGLLDGQMLSRLTKECLSIENLAGGAPQDIEWTIKSSRIWILQTRPVKKSTENSTDVSLYTRSNIAREGVEASRLFGYYRVPPTLRCHLLTVSAVGNLIADHWNGPSLDNDVLITSLLLHDIGNIAKANYSDFPLLFPEDRSDWQYWAAVQQWIRSRYGETDQTATLAIARELGVRLDVIRVIERKRFIDNIYTAAGDDWIVKIAAYADQRVSPAGLTTLNDRLEEARIRYRGVKTASVNSPNFQALQTAAQTIEQQIQGHTSLDIAAIHQSLLIPYLETLRSYPIKTGIS